MDVKYNFLDGCGARFLIFDLVDDLWFGVILLFHFPKKKNF